MSEFRITPKMRDEHNTSWHVQIKRSKLLWGFCWETIAIHWNYEDAKEKMATFKQYEEEQGVPFE